MTTETRPKKPLTFEQDLSASALSYTTTWTRKFKLSKITFKASQNITETITITYLSANGSGYDTVSRQITLSAESDYIYRPTGDDVFIDSDGIKVECTNANGVGTIRGEIKAREVLN